MARLIEVFPDRCVPFVTYSSPVLRTPISASTLYCQGSSTSASTEARPGNSQQLARDMARAHFWFWFYVSYRFVKILMYLCGLSCTTVFMPTLYLYTKFIMSLWKLELHISTYLYIGAFQKMLKEDHYSINKSFVSDNAVCRTGQSTPVLLILMFFKSNWNDLHRDISIYNV